MLAHIRRRSVPLALAALALVFALLQRPGWSSSDTKIDLHTQPVHFLAEIAWLWTPSSGLGGVESAQYAGYLFPMGPFFAVGHWLGISDWVVDRLWLGLLLAIGCWGVVRVTRDLAVARTRLGEAAAGLAYLFNPYVVVLTNRTTITLLAYALMPWLVLVARRGLRRPTRWRDPALFALLVTASGGGVNAAVVALVLLAPLALVVYESALSVVPWRDSFRFAWRALAATFAASLWWVAPAAAQAAYGVDFLRFTEPAGAIWSTTSLSESFRAMGYWISYIGVGFNGVVRPYFSDAGTLIFNYLVIAAGLLVPGLALLGFGWTRRRRYAAYFLALILLGTVIMAVGFPEGTPLRRGATFAYNHFAGVRFLRTTYKAAPLVVFGVAGLAAAALEAIPRRLRLPAALAGCALLLAAAWPFTSGGAVDKQVSWKRIPAGWKAAARDLDRRLGTDARAAVLPGQLYAFYKWGGTVDPILPALAHRPVAVRGAVPYGDLRGTDLLWTTDALLQQGRLLPGELQPLLRAMSVRDVVSATDDDPHRSGASDQRRSQLTLGEQGLAPGKRYSPSVRDFAVAGAWPLVRLEPRTPVAVVDGSADGLAGLASFSALPVRGAFSYAADLSPAALRAAARHGGTITISDSNRRRVFVVSRLEQNTGATLAAGDPISEDAAVLNPFPDRGVDAQTVAVLHGARSITAPFSPGYSQFPEHRPLAAFDGDPRTAWLADPGLDPARRTVTIEFPAARDVAAIDVLPRSEAGARTNALVVAGRRHPLHAGWNHLQLGLRRVGRLKLQVDTTNTRSAAAGGLAEVRIPGVHVDESLRPPVLAEHALRGADLRHSALQYVFTRASGDNPWERSSSAGVRLRQLVDNPSRLEQLRVKGAGDEETGIDRVIDPPATRKYEVEAWVSATPETSDAAIDRLVGARGALADSSGRFRGRPGFRASSALDGDPRSAWVAPWPPARAPLAAADAPWIRVTGGRRVALDRIRIVAPPARFRKPTRVVVQWPGGATRPLPVRGGVVTLPRTVRAAAITLRVVAAAAGRLPAVGIGELIAPGLPRMRVPRSGRLRGCRSLVLSGDGASIGLRVDGDVRALDAGRPLRASGCGRLRLAAGPARLRISPGTLRPDAVLLRSPAPAPLARAAAAPGSVRDPGTSGRGDRDGVKLDVRAPAWLVLGESYDRGWRAWCNGHSLGGSVPLDGYANAWPVERGCRDARFAFAPQRPVHILQILSALACLLLIAIACGLRAPARMRRAAARTPVRRAAARIPVRALDTSAADSPESPPRRIPLRRALLPALFVGGALAFCFSLRSGLLIAPAIAIVLWRGIGARPLAIVGGLLLAVATPIAYVIQATRDFGGYNPGYASDNISAHWLAVAAWVLLALAGWRTLSTARSRPRGEAGAGGASSG